MRRARITKWIVGVIVAICLIVGYLVMVASTVPFAIVMAGSGQICSGSTVVALSTPQPSSTPSAAPKAQNLEPKQDKLGSAASDYVRGFSQAQQAEVLQNAQTIISVGAKRSNQQVLASSDQTPAGENVVTRHDIEAAIGVSIQESNLINLPFGDRDSLGLFQQRPSQGWGTPQQIMDPVYAAGKFYDHLLAAIPAQERAKMSLIDIGIRVQIPNPSAYRSRWAWDAVAKDFVDYFLGSSQGGCGSQSDGWGLPLRAGSYCVTSPFGPRDIGYHNGIDMSCNAGNPIYAAHDGVVTVAKPNDYGWGTHVVIDHGGGVVTGYAHMVRIQPGIEPGVHVTKGQVIGYVGNTGHSFGAHLHFEVIINGHYVDPEVFMKKQGVPLR